MRGGESLYKLVAKKALVIGGIQLISMALFALGYRRAVFVAAPDVISALLILMGGAAVLSSLDFGLSTSITRGDNVPASSVLAYAIAVILISLLGSIAISYLFKSQYGLRVSPLILVAFTATSMLFPLCKAILERKKEFILPAILGSTPYALYLQSDVFGAAYHNLNSLLKTCASINAIFLIISALYIFTKYPVKKLRNLKVSSVLDPFKKNWQLGLISAQGLLYNRVDRLFYPMFFSQQLPHDYLFISEVAQRLLVFTANASRIVLPYSERIGIEISRLKATSELRVMAASLFFALLAILTAMSLTEAVSLTTSDFVVGPVVSLAVAVIVLAQYYFTAHILARTYENIIIAQIAACLVFVALIYALGPSVTGLAVGWLGKNIAELWLLKKNIKNDR